MTYGFNTPATGGSEVCPVCSEIYPAANPNCPKCGYAPGTVADSESDQAAQPAVQISYPGATGRNWGALAAVLFTLLGGGIALFVTASPRHSTKYSSRTNSTVFLIQTAPTARMSCPLQPAQRS
jgi:hypothetical protein